MNKTTSFKINGKWHFFRKVETYTDYRFEAKYKGYDFEIFLDLDEDEEPDGESRFYITVCNPEISFGTVYDGWADENITNVEQAVACALEGSMLING